MSTAWPGILKRIAEFVVVAEEGEVQIRGAIDEQEGSGDGVAFVPNHVSLSKLREKESG